MILLVTTKIFAILCHMLFRGITHQSICCFGRTYLLNRNESFDFEELDYLPALKLSEIMQLLYCSWKTNGLLSHRTIQYSKLLSNLLGIILFKSIFTLPYKCIIELYCNGRLTGRKLERIWNHIINLQPHWLWN